ncbi:hypothetical protein EBR21_11150, partial [bacterium]|nr:hypothetical protein [bacterium]
MSFKLGNIEVFPANMSFDFMKWRGLSIGISLALVIASIVVIAVKGINYSIDFLGGAEVNVTIADPEFNREKVLKIAEQAGLGKVEVTTLSDKAKAAGQSFVVRIQRERGQDERE